MSKCLEYTKGMEQSIAIRQGAPDPALDARVKFENLSDWGFQGILGLTYQLSDSLLLGVVYRSEADVNLKGDVKFQGLRIPLPSAPAGGHTAGKAALNTRVAIRHIQVSPD